MAAKPYAELAERIIAIVDWETLGIPPRHKVTPTFRAMAKGISFTSMRSLETMYSAVVDLCVYGFTDRAAQVGLALGEVDSGADGVPYLYVNASVFDAALFAELTGHPDAAALRELALNPPGGQYQRGTGSLDGRRLNLYTDEDREGMPPSNFVGVAVQDIHQLGAMYLMGSPTWSKEQIVPAVTDALAKIHATPGYEPWASADSPVVDETAAPAQPDASGAKKRWWQRD